MAGQKGFIYEAAIHTKLKNKGLVPLGFRPAASDPNKPDGKFIYDGVCKFKAGSKCWRYCI